MPLTFIHTADWQIGKSFTRFAADVAVQLRAARLDAIDRLAALARREAAAHVLVAGDVIDSELIDDAGLRQPLARMAAYPALTWHLLPGNHDPARPSGVWARMMALGLPRNVTAHLEPRPSEIEPGVILLPAPLVAKEMRTDPTAWMDGATSPEGAVRIGLAHGSVRGFGSLGEAAVPIDAGRRASARLDYLALGDWHGVKEVAAGVWYAGTPEPDSFADNGTGHALVVRLAGAGRPAQVRIEPTATHRWLARRLALARLADMEPVEAEIEALGGERRKVVLELTLEGVVSAGEAATLDERLGGLAAKLLAIDVKRGRLRTLVGKADVGRFDDPQLASVAARLGERARDDASPEARIAGRAMRLMLALDGPALPEGPRP